MGGYSSSPAREIYNKHRLVGPHMVTKDEAAQDRGEVSPAKPRHYAPQRRRPGPDVIAINNNVPLQSACDLQNTEGVIVRLPMSGVSLSHTRTGCFPRVSIRVSGAWGL